MSKVLISLIIVCFLSLNAVSQCPQSWHHSTIGNHKCYLFVTERKTWFDSELSCASAALHGHLTSIASVFENNFIDGIVAMGGIPVAAIWIGAKYFNQSDSFAWSDGFPFQYNNFGPGQPDLSSGHQCVATQPYISGKWRIDDCATKNYYFCETMDNSGVITTMQHN